MTFECKKNCGECCGIVPILKEVWENNKDKKQREFHKVMEAGGNVYVFCEGAKCVFLNPEDKRCGIYSDRPQICRNYGIGKFDALSCPYIKPNGKPRTPAMVKKVQRQIDRDVDAMMKRVEKWGKKS